MADATTTSEQPLEHPYLTTMGLLAETYEGMSTTLARRLEGDTGLSVVWFGILLRLARTPGNRLRMTDLAAQASLSASGLTRAVDRLDAAGYVEREACPDDRRGQFAVLTEAGRAKVLAALPLHVSQLTTVFDVFTPDELEHLTTLMHKLRDAANPCAAVHSDPDLSE